MEAQIKKAVRAGNSSAVILPRAWLNKEVRVELAKKTDDMILFDVINILKGRISLGEITGVYLVGSYARREEDENSDIDVLVVTRGIDSEMINEGIYNILVISSELLEQKLKRDLLPIGQMLKEAKALLNGSYLNSFEIKITKKNVAWHINTTKDKLKIIKKIIGRAKERGERNISDKVAYTLILRIRTLYIIKNLIKNEGYSKKKFIKLIKDISKGTNAYERYLAVKNNLKEKNGLSLEEAERLYAYLRNKLIEVKDMLKDRK